MSSISPAGYKTKVASKEPQKEDNEGAIKLLLEWLADDSGYDARVWPQIKQSLEENRLSERRRLDA